MLTIKNWRPSRARRPLRPPSQPCFFSSCSRSLDSANAVLFVLSGLLVLLLTACAPSGPRALLQGERLINEGKYAQAIEALTIATTALPANAQAWNHLGLAYHQAGQPEAAQKAYEQARRIDPNLTPVRFNLGCLFLEQNNPQSAIAELTAYTLLQKEAVDGWLKLGTAQLRARQWDNAERTFQTTLQLRPNSAEAWNGLGIVQLQRRRPREALNNFNLALQKQAGFAPAVLNQAILQHYYLNNRALALEKYEDYLQLEPSSAEAVRVQESVRQLRTELAPPPPREVVEANANAPQISKEAPTISRAVTNALGAHPVTNSPRPSMPTNPAAIVSRPRTTVTNLMAAAETVPGRSQPEVARKPVSAPVQVVTPTPSVPNAITSAPPAAAAPSDRVEVVHIADEPPVQLAQDNLPATKATAKETTLPASLPEPVSPNPAMTATPALTDENPSVGEKKPLNRLNPATWFRRKRPVSSSPATTPLPPVSQPKTPPPDDRRLAASQLLTSHAPAQKAPVPQRRYAYLSPAKPGVGDRRKADEAFSRALQAHRDRQLSTAIAGYREAISLDPSFYEAHYNLGLAAFDLKDLPTALSAYETALSINATSVNARYNFALALERGSYFQDAANEYEKLLEQYPAEARAHFAVAGVYADKLGRPDLARTHYRRVLELEPQHPQASDIRFWLAANP